MEQVSLLEGVRILKDKQSWKELNFEYCAWYIYQALRNWPRVFLDWETLLFCNPKHCKGDNKDRVVSVFRWPSTETICEDIKQAKNEIWCERLFVKNIDLVDREEFLKNWFKEYSDTQSRDDLSKFDDNTYPQVVVDCKEVQGMEWPERASLREEMARVQRLYPLELKSYDPNTHKDLPTPLLSKWVDDMLERDKGDREEMIRAHDFFFEENSYFTQFLAFSEKELIWFLCFSEVSKSCAWFNVLINDFNFYSSYRYLMHKWIIEMAKAWYQYCNLQGSETESQFNSKVRFKHEKLLPKIHMFV